MSRYLTRANLFLAAILVSAAFLRLYRIDQLPPGFQFDQAFNAFDVLRLLQGHFTIFFPANTGREPLYFYLMLVGVAVLGPTALALKLTSAVIGLATLPTLYVCVRAIFRSERVAGLTTLFTAISFWHIFFSRYGLRVILQVLITLLLFFFLWRALEQPRFNKSTWIKIGVMTALALYTYPTGRLLPLAIIFLVLYAVWSNRTHAIEYGKGLGWAFATSGIIFLPLGIYFLAHPDHFISHSAQVSVFAIHGTAIADVLPAILKNALHLAGMFSFAGDAGALRNLPGRPIFDPWLSVLFFIGVGVWLVNLVFPEGNEINRRRAMLIATWLVIGLAASLFSDDAPNFLRTLPTLPAVMILPAWGAATILEKLRATFRRLAMIALMAIIVMSTWLTFRDYFIVLANDPGTYYAFDVDKVELSDWLNEHASQNHIYLAPLLAQNGTISLLTRHAALKSFESRDTIVLPGKTLGKDALFVFPWEQTKKIQTLSDRLGLGRRTELTGTNGGILALIYRVPADHLPDEADPLATLARGGTFVQPQKIERAQWNDAFELLGYSISAADPAQRNLEVILFLHALKPMSEVYTFSIKVRDGQDRVWGQEDKWTGNNSYPTTQWSPGEIIIEKFYPGLNACAPAGEYRLSLEAYNPKTMQPLGAAIELGTHRAAVSQGNLYEHLEPEQIINANPLFGYTLTPKAVRAGESFSLALFWHGVGKGQATQRLSVTLRDAAQHPFLLHDQSFGLPNEGRGLCTFFDFTVSPDATPGSGSIWVNEIEIATIDITR